jgi:ABC-type nitrate/sulfonate/bicarbonate transport system permease component
MRAVRTMWPPLLLIALIIAGWEVIVRWRAVPEYLLPSPSQIVAAAITAGPLLPGHLGTTVTEALLGIALGGTAGVALALSVALSEPLRRAVAPLLVVSQTIPLVVLAPLLVVWLGFGAAPKVVVVALIVVFPVAVSTAAGLGSADPELVELVRSMGGHRFTVLRTVSIPTAIPACFAGLRISVTYAVGGAVVGEWVGATSGLGVFIDQASRSYRVDDIFVATVLIAGLSFALYGAVGLVARWASPWLDTTESSSSPVLAGRTRKESS